MDTTPRTEPLAAAVRRRTVLPAAAAAWSALTLVLGLWWWLRPGAYPFAPGAGDPAGTALALVPTAVVPPALVAAGVWGLLVAGPARRGAAGTALVTGTGIVYALVFGLAVPGVAPLTLVGYMMAMFGPVVLFATVLAGAWRLRGDPAAVAVFVLVGAAAWITGVADGDVLARYAGVVTGAMERLGPPAALLFLLVGGLLWGVLAARTALTGHGTAPAWTRPESAARWGRAATLVAAACALPYGLHRLTWLTPWPVGMPVTELANHPEMRLHGLLLGLAALAGALLTLGLISRWGEVWPRWMPVVRGRPVPVAAAVVPGTLVAALFTVAAIPMIVMAVSAGEPWMLLVFPFPLWGPALGAAVLGYALRRRAPQPAVR